MRELIIIEITNLLARRKCATLMPQLCQIKIRIQGAHLQVISHLLAKFQDSIPNGLVRGASTEK